MSERDSSIPDDPAELHDPLRPFTSAWRALTPPEPTAPLKTPDAETAATIAWLRRAWQTVAPDRAAPSAPPNELPWRLRRRIALARIARPFRDVGPGLVAAAAVVLAALFFFAGEHGSSPPLHEEGAIPTELAAGPAPDSITAVSPAPSSVPVLTQISADRMELRSGPVRLILFTPNSSTSPALEDSK